MWCAAEPSTEAQPSGADKRKRKRERERIAAEEAALLLKPLSSFEIGSSYPGVIKTIKKIGVFIDIGGVRDGFCHVSRLRDGFVKNATDVVKVGEKVSARVVDVMLKQNKITLSLQSETLADRERESVARFKGESDTQTPKEQASASKRHKRSAEKQEERNKRRREKREKAAGAAAGEAAEKGGE